MAFFRMFCVAIAAVSMLGFYVSSWLFDKQSLLLPTSASVSISPPAASPHAPQEGVDDEETRKKNQVRPWPFFKQLLLDANFARFSAVRLLQTFMCSFEKNHLCLFLHVMAGHELQPATLALLISLSFVLPHMGVICLSPALRHCGLYRVIQGLMLTKAGLTLLVLGRCLALGAFERVAHPGSVAIVTYLCAARIFTECTCRLFPLLIAQLVDEDTARHSRQHSMGASIVGASALLSKPGESLAPILGWKLLGVAGFASSAAASPHDVAPAPTAADKGHDGEDVLLVVLLVPLISVVLQLFMWRRYSLSSKSAASSKPCQKTQLPNNPIL
jgi:Na+/melibiose symporter-like transporter